MKPNQPTITSNIITAGNFQKRLHLQQVNKNTLAHLQTPPPTCISGTTSLAPYHDKFLVPPSFYCPLTCDVMFDPVLDIQGNSFERVAIEGWLRVYKTSPLTFQPMEARSLIPNKSMRNVIHGFMGSNWRTEKQQHLPTVPVDEFISTSRRKRSCQHICQYRQTIDEYLEDISNSINVELALDKDGACAFQYKSLNFHVKVDENCSRVTLSCESLVKEITDETKEKMLQLSHFQTRGACLTLESAQDAGEKLRLVYVKSISVELSSKKFGHILDDFLDTAISLKVFLTPHSTSESESDKASENKRKRQPEENTEDKKTKLSDEAVGKKLAKHHQKGEAKHIATAVIEGKNNA